MSDQVAQSQSEAVKTILVKRRMMEAESNPDLRLCGSTVLKDGPRVKKIVTHWMIVDRTTGNLHHHSIKLETWRKNRDSWTLSLPNTISLGEEGSNDIDRLRIFLDTIGNPAIPELTGDYFVVPVADHQTDKGALFDILTSISTHSGGAAIARSLSQVTRNPEALEAFLKNTADDPDGSRFAAAAINLGLFRSAIRQLQELIERNAQEREYQKLLEDNPWMFGSEYSELLDRRIFTRDEQQDFVLRRTADSFLEVIEIKTTLGRQDLFTLDRSRNVLYPRADLSAAIAQVMSYLEQIDAERYNIKVKDNEDVNKIRAKVIIGCDGDAQQRNALRRLNGHLHRVEVLTFDQLLRIAERVVGYLERDARASRLA